MMMLVPCLIMMMCHLLIFLDAQIARVIQHDVVESDDEIETKNSETLARAIPPRYELPKVP